MAGMGIGKMAYDIAPGPFTWIPLLCLCHTLHFLKLPRTLFPNRCEKIAVGKNAYWPQGYLAQDGKSGRDYHEN
jgi:hypothetical protein